LYEVLSLEVVLSSEVYMTASVDVLRGQGNLKTQKFLQKWSEIAPGLNRAIKFLHTPAVFK
jgi:hypothetical protein